MKKIHVKSLPEFDISEYLNNRKTMADYLTIVLEENGPAAFTEALGAIARARGMEGVAKESGITRAALYKALRANSAPRFDTINRVCTALGVKLVVKPASASH